MKRLILFLSLVAGICSFGFAEEVANGNSSAKVQYRITSGGFWSCGSDFSGGLGEFGLNLLPEEKYFVLRDCLYVQGSGGYLAKNDKLDFGGIEIGNKLILGGRSNGPGFIVRSYGFTSISFGLFSYEGHKFISSPFLINLTFGGGFEFQYQTRNAFVIEFGGLNRILTGEIKAEQYSYEDFSKSNPVLTIGFRSFI